MNRRIIVAASVCVLLGAPHANATFYGRSGGGSGSNVVPDSVTITSSGSNPTVFSGVPATATNPGTLSAAGYSSLSSLGVFDAWEIKQQTTCARKATGLAWKPIYVGSNPFSGAAGNATADGNREGGGVTPVSASWRTVSNAVSQFAKTHAWCLAMRGKLPAPGASGADMGLVSGDVAKDVVIESLTASDATKYVLRWDNAGASKSTNQTIADDGLTHDFVIVNDGQASPTVWLYVDDVLDASMAVDTHIADAVPMQVGTFNTTSVLDRASYGFIQQTN